MRRALEVVDPVLADRFSRCGFYTRCGLWRFCSWCRRTHARNVVERPYRAALEAAESLFYVVLTQPSVPKLTEEARKKFSKAVQLFRGRADVRRAFLGGIAVTEVEPGRGGWSLHLNLIVEVDPATKVNWDAIKRHWHSLTGGQEVKWEAVYDLPGLLDYITKAPTMPQDADRLRELIDTLIGKGVRMVASWGSIRRNRNCEVSVKPEKRYYRWLI